MQAATVQQSSHTTSGSLGSMLGAHAFLQAQILVPFYAMALAGVAMAVQLPHSDLKFELLGTKRGLLVVVLSTAVMQGALGLAFQFAIITTAAFACRTLCLGVTMVTINGLSGYRWLALLGICVHSRDLARRLRELVVPQKQWAPGVRPNKEEAELSHSIVNQPCHMIGLQGLVDQLGVLIAQLIWYLVVLPLTAVCNYVLPYGLSCYACNEVIPDFGPHVDVGVAAHLRGGAASMPSRSAFDHQAEGSLVDTPGYFVYNVGHVDLKHTDGREDLRHTMRTTQDAWEELRDEPGLVTNVVCIFPEMKGTTFAKEINLSSWRSPADAREWYIKSKAHTTIMKQHSSGGLRTFGNALAPLTPARPIRLQDRCSRCARVLEAESAGAYPPQQCPWCKASAFHYPVF
eukprot:gnl/MRDRNA2_/MRDRNA2_22384_c0_seq1.p1 gnl/MRDRNA2_/MRDRNA2_22384_c0~~gnl/MRDRNA2_/MRDRNA2_22384_c0_seq1.p1  ORF type:complete len:430 (-),score=48.96 gnl/MRDRNA2_/MRDRNA2_22384_c0_seq1:5-1213(-)